jgi:hypothetical protein
MPVDANNLLKVALAVGLFYLGVFRLHATDREYLITAWKWFIASLFATAVVHLTIVWQWFIAYQLVTALAHLLNIHIVMSGREIVRVIRAVEYILIAMTIIYLYKSILTKR